MNIRSFIFFILALANIHASDSDKTIYESQHLKSSEAANTYLKTNRSLARYLGYRDIPFFITNYASGTKTLDYGAGTGFSTQFLLTQGLEVIGVDISQAMLIEAKESCPETPFYLIEDGKIPTTADSFDIVFSSLVLFELSAEYEMLSYLQEAKRVMKDDGVFIALTGSEHMYTGDWLIFNADYPQNKNLKSGDLAKIYLHDASIEFTDYFWTEADYRRFFEKAGFDLEIHYPLGYEHEELEWKDEMRLSPFVVLIARKQAL